MLLPELVRVFYTFSAAPSIMDTASPVTPASPEPPVHPPFDDGDTLEWTATFEAFDPINGPDSNICGLVQEAAGYYPSMLEEDEELAMRLAIAYGKTAGEPRLSICGGIRVSSGEPCQFGVTKTGCGLNYCNQHKNSAPLPVIANGVPPPVNCVACGNPSEDKSKDMFGCISCAIGLHRYCLFQWAADQWAAVLSCVRVCTSSSRTLWAPRDFRSS